MSVSDKTVFTVPHGVGSKVARNAGDKHSLKRKIPHTLTPYPKGKRHCSEWSDDEGPVRPDDKDSDQELTKNLLQSEEKQKETQCEFGIEIDRVVYPTNESGLYDKATVARIKANVEARIRALLVQVRKMT